MNTEKQMTDVVIHTILKLGHKAGDKGVLDAMKEAVLGIHVALRKERECLNRDCHKCDREDCPVEKYYQGRKCC